MLGTPTTSRPPHPPKRRPDPVQHGSPSSLPRDPLSSSADTGTRSRGAGQSRLAARTPWGHLGGTSLPSVTDNTGHERSAHVPGQQLTSARIAGPMATLFSLARRKPGVQIPSPPPHNSPSHRPSGSPPPGRRCSRFPFRSANGRQLNVPLLAGALKARSSATRPLGSACRSRLLTVSGRGLSAP